MQTETRRVREEIKKAKVELAVAWLDGAFQHFTFWSVTLVKVLVVALGKRTSYKQKIDKLGLVLDLFRLLLDFYLLMHPKSFLES